VCRWHRARPGQDQSVSDYLTYCENLEDKIGDISEELRALSQLVGYRVDIRDGFPNDHIPLTHERISRIALNVESKYKLKGKDRVYEGGAKPSNGDSSTQHDNLRVKSHGRDQRPQRSWSRGYRGTSQGDGKRNDGGPSGDPRPPSERPSDGFKMNEGCRRCGKMGHFAKECIALEPKRNAAEGLAQGKAKA
jgi:hypothetical protein